MARNIAGLPNRLFDGIHDYAWVGPLAPIWLLVGIVCVSLAYATWLTILAGVKVVR
jgi:hypothetical protein